MEEMVFEKIGDHIAANLGYMGLRGMEAVHRYLIDKYGWEPEHVRRLSEEDLRLLLSGYEDKEGQPVTCSWGSCQ